MCSSDLLTGDAVDGIRGVDGIGPVRCKTLFKKINAEMSLEQGTEIILGQLTDEQAKQFLEALKLTLPKRVPDISSFQEIRLIQPAEIRELKIPQIDYYYEEIYSSYMEQPF